MVSSNNFDKSIKPPITIGCKYCPFFILNPSFNCFIFLYNSSLSVSDKFLIQKNENSKQCDIFTIITIFFSILASKGNLCANGATLIYAEGPVSKIGFSTSSSATEPDANTIKTLSSPYTFRQAYNSSYLNNTSIGQNSLMYIGELQSGTYRKFFFYYGTVTEYYNDGSTVTGVSNYWGNYTIPGDPLTISDNENGRIQFNWTGTVWEVTKTAL